MVQIRYLDGRRFKRAVLAGVVTLDERREHLNRINVYPVPDADTGTNMSLTMRSAAEGLKAHSHRSIALTSQTIAECAVLGSQGNSGAILAQFLKGLSDGLSGKVRVTIHEFAQAVERAKQAAYAALSKPREGTILTVMKDWSDYIVAARHEGEDFVVLLKGALATAKESLRRTPEQLSVLKEHGVVDAGAEGFVDLLEGITQYVESGEVQSHSHAATDAEEAGEPARFAFTHGPQDLAFRYCAECVLETAEEVTRERLEPLLDPLGDCLVVASAGRLLKVHLHTNEPARFMDVLAPFGVLLRHKQDDMQEQHLEALQDHASVGLVTDSACDLAEAYTRQNYIEVVPLKLLFGDQVFLDRIQLTPAGFLRQCQVSPHHPKTSQPSVHDYLKAYAKASKNGAREVVAVCLSGGVSGTFQAALTAAAQFEGAKVHVVDSRSLTVAQGLLVQEAREMALAGAGAGEIAVRLEGLRDKMRLFISLRTLEFARRGGRVSAARSLMARVLGIRPVISFDSEGKVISAAKAFGVEGVKRKVLDLARMEWERRSRFRLAVAHMASPEDARYYVENIRRLTGLDVPIAEATPVLGCHSGPGAAGIAVLGLD